MNEGMHEEEEGVSRRMDGHLNQPVNQQLYPHKEEDTWNHRSEKKDSLGGRHSRKMRAQNEAQFSRTRHM